MYDGGPVEEALEGGEERSKPKVIKKNGFRIGINPKKLHVKENTPCGTKRNTVGSSMGSRGAEGNEEDPQSKRPLLV